MASRIPSFDADSFAKRLIGSGLIEKAAAARVLDASKKAGTGIEKTLLEFGLVEEDVLFREIANCLGLPYIELDGIDTDLARRLGLSPDFLTRVDAFPAYEGEKGLCIVVSDPRSQDAIDSIGFHLKTPVQPAISAPSSIRAALAVLSGAEQETKLSSSESDIERLKALANDGPVIKLVNEIIAQAVMDGASDIHIEADAAGLRVRYRVDGILRSVRKIPDIHRANVVSRLKVMANLNISERRRPQDGRVDISVRGRTIDIRLSTLPTQFGESIALRLLDRTRMQLDWEALGFEPGRVGEIESILTEPNGIFLVAGPTGSGKTTTLYTALSSINSEDRKIITVEDPIEYSLEGVNQLQVDPAIDMSFARALRAILRQDPDVIMVGEIRDQETAEIAVRAALVGRLVLSTIHTNDSLSAVDRLLDLGVPRYLLAATLRGVLSQRLIRCRCVSCGGAGCGDCNNTGLKGRTVISELLRVSPLVADCIAGRSKESLTSAAKSSGFVTLAERGRHLVKSGVIFESEFTRLLGFYDV